jgi:dTDP-4-amino-4,6-dideoxygalactose transaminase
MECQIPLSDIDFGLEEQTAVQGVLESRWLSLGGITQAFEDEFARFTGANHAIAVTNCTAALHLACLAVGLKPGDEAIVPSFTFVATVAAIRYTGATPVFGDVTSVHDFNISAASIEEKLTERTRAIVVMHYGGYACEMPEILDIAARHNLVVIEDAAQAPGSELHGRSLGTWGAVGCFSFFSNKNLTTGEGGMVVTNDDDIAQKIRLLRSHGMTTLTWDRHRGHASSYDVTTLGYNYRIDEIRSAIGRVQLRKLSTNNARRKKLTEMYRHALAESVPEVTLPFTQHRGSSAYHLLPILLPPKTDRRQFMELMRQKGIQTSIHYPPVHRFSNYQEPGPCVHLPLTEKIASREITLPLYPTLEPSAVETVVNAVRSSLTEVD